MAINTNDFTTTTETNTKLTINGAVKANGYTPFTGCHPITNNSYGTNNLPTPGMILVSNGNVIKNSIINTIVSAETTTIKNNKCVYGVYSHSEIINQQQMHYVASVGEGCVLICDINGELQNGDLVVSSYINGYGMKQDDDLMRSCTVAKITETIDWTSITDTVTYTDGHSNTTQRKYILASCTYHCG